MKLMRYSWWITILILTGCASLSLIEHNPTARLDPSGETIEKEQPIGEAVILGGEIATLSYEAGGTRLELNRLKLNDRGYPMIHSPLESEKVVIFLADQRLGGSLYESGNYFAANGILTATEWVTIGGKRYQIHSLKADKYSAWEANQRRFDRFDASRRGYYRYYGFGGGYYYPYW